MSSVNKPTTSLLFDRFKNMQRQQQSGTNPQKQLAGTNQQSKIPNALNTIQLWGNHQDSIKIQPAKNNKKRQEPQPALKQQQQMTSFDSSSKNLLQYSVEGPKKNHTRCKTANRYGSVNLRHQNKSSVDFYRGTAGGDGGFQLRKSYESLDSIGGAQLAQSQEKIPVYKNFAAGGMAGNLNMMTSSSGNIIRTNLKNNGSLLNSVDQLEVVSKKYEPLFSTLDVEDLRTAACDDTVNFAESKHFATVAEYKAHRASTAKKSRRSMSMITFNTMGSGYTVPKQDFKYHIKYGLKLGKGVHAKQNSQTYMSKVVSRAKSSVDPRKYTPQVDWRRQSLSRPNLSLPRGEKVTMTMQTIRDKKKIPAPGQYKNTDQRPKIYGFYGVTTNKHSIFESQNFAKSFIPGPSQYESRGKSMAQILKQKANNFMFQDAADFTTTSKITKTDQPGPTSYKVIEALDESAQIPRKTVKNAFAKAKNINYIQHLLQHKKKIPGVGSYKMEELDKKLSRPTTSIKMRRH